MNKYQRVKNKTSENQYLILFSQSHLYLTWCLISKRDLFKSYLIDVSYSIAFNILFDVLMIE